MTKQYLKASFSGKFHRGIQTKPFFLYNVTSPLRAITQNTKKFIILVKINIKTAIGRIFNCHISDHNISQSAQANTYGFVQDNKKQMCQVLSDICINITLNCCDNDLKGQFFWFSFKILFFEIPYAFLARHYRHNLSFALGNNL